MEITITVATSKAVKTAYDLANTANQNANNANSNTNTNTRLAKDQNGADIPNKEEFVKNLGLEPRMEGLALPVGVPVPWPTENPPEGWLICNGDSFDKAKYPKLAIAYPSGKLPDLRSEFIRGADAGRGIDPTINVLSATHTNPHLPAGLSPCFGFSSQIPHQAPNICPQFPQSTQLPANLPY
ncbi:phage tail protein [Xenorhabdus bovienii]|uniref:phage tail protein n=1 Tax=Xenorhabdus bovienii TaxID=40576 RepID=UPI0030612C6A|nr:phage tail protein [Xenorhabdus bovienii]